MEGDKIMIKAVNMKGYRFGKLGNIEWKGYAMLDTDTNEFLSIDGFKPYVLTRKKYIQSCIDGGWASDMKRVNYTCYVK